MSYLLNTLPLHGQPLDPRDAEMLGTAATLTFACATDGDHGRSVAQGAQFMGARAVIFHHSGVSGARIETMERFGAEIIRVKGNYDDSVAEAARVAQESGWTLLSDTSWPGYEYEPSLVAFRILERVADGFMLVDEDSAPEVMRRLAAPAGGDPAVVASESGGAGLAGVITLLRDATAAARIGLGPQARVLVINTEGAIDPALYARIVGLSPETVLTSAASVSPRRA